jgi:protein ImuB
MYCCLCGDGKDPSDHAKARLLALAFEFSPVVERSAADAVTFDASGLDRLFGLPQDVAAAVARRAAESRVKTSIAIASNPDAAICAARGFSGVSMIPYGDEAKFLGELPIGLLAPSPELQETLERWGIRRFRELGALPPLGIAERLGPEGLRLRELARGEVSRKLLPLEDAARFEDEIELEYPVELLEPLAFLLARLLNGLATSLAARALATNELRLRLRLENRATHERTLRLPVPSLDAKAFLKLMQLDLEAHPPQAPIVHIWMGANPVKPQAAQSGFFIPAAPEPVKLELTLARIKAIVGENRAGIAERLNTHRPDAFRMMECSLHVGQAGRYVGQAGSLQRVVNPLADARNPDQSHDRKGVVAVGRTPWSAAGPLAGLPAVGCFAHAATPLSVSLALRLFRPPLPARVTVAAHGPSYIAAENIRGKVIELAGPWRTSGDWWTLDPWLRDEWDLALSGGALYRVYCEPRGWFVEGSYD